MERAKIIKPSGRADLNPNLGYPDFEPAIPGLGEKEKEEDKLSAKVRNYVVFASLHEFFLASSVFTWPYFCSFELWIASKAPSWALNCEFHELWRNFEHMCLN